MVYISSYNRYATRLYALDSLIVLVCQQIKDIGLR